MTKQNIAILCGGQSVEHDVSLLSASNVIRELAVDRFNPIVIYITKEGRWLWASDSTHFLKQAQDMQIDTSTLEPICLQPGSKTAVFMTLNTNQPIAVDCVFPVLHGACGEDGTMQGLLHMLNVPYVGCDALSSAICMEKHIVKQLLRHAGIPTLDWIAMSRKEKSLFTYAEVTEQLGPVVFMKTVASGSSIGVYKVRCEQEYRAALEVIFNYDEHIIIEKGVNARELEVSVLGNDEIATTPPGEVLVYADFYTYEAKYFDAAASKVVTPANITEDLSEQLQALAAKAFRVLRCKGMARIDFLVVNEDDFYLIVIDPLPGFTNNSMYPKSWAAAGVSYKTLLSRLIDVAHDTFATRELLAHGVKSFVTQKREQQSAI